MGNGRRVDMVEREKLERAGRSEVRENCTWDILYERRIIFFKKETIINTVREDWTRKD